MTEATVLEIAKNAMMTAMQVSMPLLLSTLVIGTLVGVIMAATQVQEFTLTFVPKVLVLALVLLMAGPWMLRSLVNFASMLLRELPHIVQ